MRYLLIFDSVKGYQFYYKSTSRNAFRHLKRENVCSFNANAIKIVDLKENRVVSEAIATEVNDGRVVYS